MIDVYEFATIVRANVARGIVGKSEAVDLLIGKRQRVSANHRCAGINRRLPSKR
ncbi:MAG: hypothetical protein ACUVSY_13560 [Roseiflexus sp.]